MVDILYTHYQILKSFHRMVDDGFHFRKSFVWMIDVLHTRFDIRGRYLRTVDVRAF